MNKILERLQLERKLIYAKYNKQYLKYLYYKIKLWKGKRYG